jgi:hypothetical protein
MVIDSSHATHSSHPSTNESCTNEACTNKKLPDSETPVDRITRQHILDVVQHRCGLAERTNAHAADLGELSMAYRHNDRIILVRLRRADQVDAVFVQRGRRLYPRVENVDLRVVAVQGLHDIDHPGVTPG